MTISHGGSIAFACQVVAGAPADVFVSAAVNRMDVVDQAGLVLPAPRRELFGNALVPVARGRDAAHAAFEAQGFRVLM